MAIFKCLNNYYVSTTQEILKKLNGWKRIRLTLTKVYNHIKFINKALKEKVLPVGFKKNLNVQVRNVKETQWRIGKLIMKEAVDELYRKQNRLKNEELTLRNYLGWKFTGDEWQVIEEKVCEAEISLFSETRSRQIHKMNKLLLEKDINKKVNIDKDINGRLINLSKYELSADEERLLLRGLDFSPMDCRVDKLAIAVNVEGIMKNLGMHDNLIVKDIINIYEEKSQNKDNLSKNERLALENLRNNPNIIISYSDKGKVVLVLDKEDYIFKLRNVLKGKEYELLNKDPTSKIDKQIREIASKCKKENEESKLYYKLVGEDTRWPSVFGNIKVHKAGLPLRLIVSSFGTVTENAADFVKNILNYYVENHQMSDITLGISHMKEELKTNQLKIEDDCILASIDIVNMFTNISTVKAYNIIKDKIENEADFETRSGMSRNNFLQLVEILLNNSYFKYEDNFFRQSQGIPMGSGISPVVADLVMLDLEKELWQLESSKRLLYYKRFRDDSFIVWKGSKGLLLEFIEDLNGLDNEGLLKFTVEVENNRSLPFLDAKISIIDNQLKFEVYEKPYCSGTLLNFNSHQDIGIKKGIISGETTRYFRISDKLEEDLEKLKEKLMNNDYPKQVCEEVMEGTIKKRRKEEEKQKERNKKKDQLNYLGLPFPGKAKAKKLRKLGKKFGFKIAFGRSQTLGNLFSNKFKYNTKRKKGLIYSIKCLCGDEYIGETGKSLDERMKKHKYSISRIDMNNGLAVHSQDCNKGFNWNEAKILGWEGNWFRRKLKESLWIEKKNPKMNLSAGWKLRGKWQAV